MSNSPAAPASSTVAHDVPTPLPDSGTPAVDVASTDVLITEQEVLLGTATTVRARRRTVSRAERPRPAAVPRRYEFLDSARMAREMGRL